MLKHQFGRALSSSRNIIASRKRCATSRRVYALSRSARDRTRRVAYFMRHQLAPISSADDPTYTVNPLRYERYRRSDTIKW